MRRFSRPYARHDHLRPFHRTDTDGAVRLSERGLSSSFSSDRARWHRPSPLGPLPNGAPVNGINVDVAVVGAGFSGLAAALALKGSGASVLVLEARERVGGRSMAGSLNGRTVDLGGQWIGPLHTHLAALANRFGVTTKPQYSQGRKIVEYRGKISSYSGLVPALPIVGLVEAQHMINRINRLAQSVPIDAPWTAPNAAALDAETVETWKRRTVRTKAARAVLDISTRAIFTAEPSDLSLLWFLFYCQAGRSFEALASIENGAQARVFEGGAHQIADAMARELGASVQLNSPVRAVSQSDEGVVVETTTGKIAARAVIIALPPTLAGRIAYSPPVPVPRDALFQRMAMGSVIKVASPMSDRSGAKRVCPEKQLATRLLSVRSSTQAPRTRLSGRLLVSSTATRHGSGADVALRSARQRS